MCSCERRDARRRALRWWLVGPIGEANLINAFAVAQGKWWRIFTSAFFHLGPLHLAFNMYVLYLYGQLAERMYGRSNSLRSTCSARRAAACSRSWSTRPSPRWVRPARSSAWSACCSSSRDAITRCSAARRGRWSRASAASSIFLLVFTFVVPGHQLDRPRRWPDRRRHARLLPAANRRRDDGGMWRAPSGERLNGGDAGWMRRWCTPASPCCSWWVRMSRSIA